MTAVLPNVVGLTEHYVRMNYEGEGRPCLYQVIIGGDQGEILRKEGQPCITPFDAKPFAAALAGLERDEEYPRLWGATREDIQNARKIIGMMAPVHDLDANDSTDQPELG